MIVSTTTDAGLLSRLSENTAGLRTLLNTALEQQGSGKVAQTFAGLGNGVRTSLDLRPALQHRETWVANIDRTAGRLDATQNALTQISGIAADFFAKVNAINNVGVPVTGSIATDAKTALEQVGQLLNARSGDIYVFAGQDTANKPVPDTDPDALRAALLASDTATAPFSATLGTAVPRVEVGEGEFVQAGLLANRNTLATSAAPTTGSFLRDVMKSLAQLSQLTDGSTDAAAVAATVRTQLQGAISAMGQEAGALGDLQKGLDTRRTALTAAQTTLSKQVSGVEDVDMAATLTKVSALQTQLQASYQVIAGVKDLSLAKFL